MKDLLLNSRRNLVMNILKNMEKLRDQANMENYSTMYLGLYLMLLPLSSIRFDNLYTRSSLI